MSISSLVETNCFCQRKLGVFGLNICGKWFVLKVSELDTDVPLLLSRPALAQLGMRYDLPANMAFFWSTQFD